MPVGWPSAGVPVLSTSPVRLRQVLGRTGDHTGVWGRTSATRPAPLLPRGSGLREASRPFWHPGNVSGPNVPTTLAAAGGRGSAVDHRTLRQLCRHDRPLDLQGPGHDLQRAVRGKRRQGRGEGQDRRRLHSEPVRRRRHLRRPQRARKGTPTFWHKGNVGGAFVLSKRQLRRGHMAVRLVF